jgi:hypothetical protein
VIRKARERYGEDSHTRKHGDAWFFFFKVREVDGIAYFNAFSGQTEEEALLRALEAPTGP